MTKTCSDRKPPGSTTEYGRKELESMMKKKFPLLTSKAIRSLSKQQLCRKLGVVWTTTKKDGKKSPDILSEEQVCTTRRCTRSYPNRLTKTSLVAQVGERFPKYSRTALRLMSIPMLCSMLNKPVLKCPSSSSSSPSPKPKTKHPPPPLSGKNDDAPPPQQSSSCIQRSAFPLRKHQTRVIEYMNTHRGMIAYHTVGTGKTLTAITLSQCFLDHHPGYKVFVVTPASLVQNFKKQMMDYQNIRHASQYQFFSIQKFVMMYKKMDLECKNVLLIIDEAHNLKTLYKKKKAGCSHAGKKPSKPVGVHSHIAEKCSNDAMKILLLTGTPVTNSPKDLVSLYNLIREPSESRMDTKKKDLGLRQISYTPELLLEKLKCKISVFDERSLEYYPRVVEHEVFLKMTPSYEEKYDRLLSEEGGLSNLAIKMFGEIDITRFYNGFRRAVNTLEGEDSPKIDWVLRKLRSSSPGVAPRKTIVFSHFLDAGNKAIIKNLPASITYRYINGSLSQKERASIVEEYNANKIQVLFISKAGGEGLDLKGTQDIIILEPAWNMSVEEQVIGRGVRYKSHSGLPELQRRVDVYRLYLVKAKDLTTTTTLTPNQTGESSSTSKTKSKTTTVEMSSGPSIDLMMRHLIQRKEKELERFRQQLKEISIENAYCS